MTTNGLFWRKKFQTVRGNHAPDNQIPSGSSSSIYKEMALEVQERLNQLLVEVKLNISSLEQSPQDETAIHKVPYIAVVLAPSQILSLLSDYVGRFNSIVKAYDSDKNDWLRNKKSELNDLGKVEELLTQEKNEIDKKNAGSHAKK